MQVIQNIKSTVYNIDNHKLTSNYIKHSHFQTSSAVFAILSLCLFTLATVFPLSSAEQRTEAATGTASNTSLTLSTTGGASLDLSVNNSNGTFAETSAGNGQAEFTVTTTNYTGYTLSISASDNTGTLIKSEDDNTTTNSIASLPTGSSLTAAEFNNATYNGKWGYKPSKLNSEANTNYLPAPTTEATTLDETSAPNTTANTYTIDLAARLQYTQNSGDYTKTFVLTAVANKINYSITYNPSASIPSDVTNMPSPNPQSGDTNSTEITLSASTPTREGYTFKGWCTASTGTDGTDTCSGTTYQPTSPNNTFPIDQTTINTTTLYAIWEKDAEDMQYWRGCSSMNIGDTITLKDSRDGTKYLVGKLKKSSSDSGTTGGWCWMLDNLALDIADSDVQANMTNSTTNASDTQLGYLKNGGGSSPNTAYAVSKAWNSSNTSDYYDRPLINVDLINTVPSTKYGSGSGKVGVYYNYCAASAGTYCYSSSSSSGNAFADVCPAGWRLPTGGSVDTSVTPNLGEFQTLYTAYGSNHTNFTTALSTPLSGSFFSGSAYDWGSYGYWWSSTRLDNANMYYIDVNTSGVRPQNYSSRSYGFSIRCILKSDAEIISETETMQSITNDQLATIMPSNGGTASLRDARDDQIYTLAKINGNYWMTRNLAIGCNGTGSTYGSTITGKALTPADSNISSDWTLPATAFNSSNNSATTGYSTPAMQCDFSRGGYYNYSAASAGIVSGYSNGILTTHDICPKGWRLPTQSEFSGITGYSSAFSPAYSGYYASGSFSNNGYGYWWSSTAQDGANRYYLFYAGGSMGIHSTYRYSGYSVRCIHKSDDEKQMDSIATMQGLGSLNSSDKNAIISSLPSAKMYTLKDNRDNQEYAIAKLRDGKIWMITNLNLGATALTTDLTSANTHLSTTITASTFNGWKKSSGTGTYTAAEYIPLSGADSSKSFMPYGTLYNYCAVSAQTICAASDHNNDNAAFDICPKGWRLPTGGSDGEFQTLYSFYNSNAKMRDPISSDGAAFALSGEFSSSSPDNQGGSGAFWSSTHYNGSFMYYLYLDSSYVYPAIGNGRGNGYSIRCVLQ